jgi:hypothetical protein
MSRMPPLKSSWPWILGAALLVAAATAAVVRLRSGRPDARSADRALSSDGVRCISISPDRFTVGPGGRQEIVAKFSRGSGYRRLTWSANGGVLMTSAGRSETPTLDADIYVDDFDDGVFDAVLWRREAPKDTAVTEKQGVLWTLLGDGNEDRAARLETSNVIEGDFAAQVTVRDVTAKKNRGAAALTFVMLDGHETHVQAISGPGYAALEANARGSDGTWRTSVSTLYGGGVVTLLLVRVGSTLSSAFDRGSGQIPLGVFSDVSAAPGRLRLETWSLDEHPTVESELDNFGAGQNTVVVWQAPSDAAPGTWYSISLSAGCNATAHIGKPSPAP